MLTDAPYRRTPRPTRCRAAVVGPRAGLRLGSGAFTLIEFMVVNVIVSIMAVLMVSGVGRVVDRVQVQHCQSNLRDIGMALELYSGLWGGRLPPSAGPEDDNLRAVYPDCLKSFEAFVCPATENRINFAMDLEDNAVGGRLGAPGHSYEYLSHYLFGPDGDELAIPIRKSRASVDLRADSVWLLTDAMESGVPGMPDLTDNHWEAGGNVLYADSHVEWIEGERWIPDFNHGNTCRRR